MLSETGGQKRKTPKTAENTGMPEKPREVVRVDPKNMLSIKLSTEARCFSLCEVKLNVRLRSKLGECPKMMVGMLLESRGKTKPT